MELLLGESVAALLSVSSSSFFIQTGICFFADQVLVVGTVGGFSTVSSAPGTFFIHAGVCFLADQVLVVGVDGGFSVALSLFCSDSFALAQVGAGEEEWRRGEATERRGAGDASKFFWISLLIDNDKVFFVAIVSFRAVEPRLFC